MAFADSLQAELDKVLPKCPICRALAGMPESEAADVRSSIAGKVSAEKITKALIAENWLPKETDYQPVYRHRKNDHA